MTALILLFCALWVPSAALIWITAFMNLRATKHGEKRRASLDFLWFDLWVGAFYDQVKRIWYVCPLPCVVFKFKRKPLSTVASVLGSSEK